MNGDDKEEAHRPRPLSAGIWTLFSWLRRSERSSSSESVSSVGSARTAVSFDFLAPGNYNFTNTSVVLTTPLNPPTETYKKRLQERNLRRERDRDVTLHRKYGLFREYGNGYDGFTLPSARRTLANTADRPNRERRATSECLQRRAAYVPGKRRAPLPPAIAISASLPRTYKRKRPAPKPPIKDTFKDNNTIIQLINNPVRMTSNSAPEANILLDNELLNSSKTQKCEKKNTTSKDTKTRTDKNFLKHIFENRKRTTVSETTSMRLLPSISELDKQATEIIENNKLRQKINNVNSDEFNNSRDTTVLYEGNSWFCTSCLRKYNSSIDSCNYCSPDKRHSLKNDALKISSPRSSIYTQTNNNVDTAKCSVDERKMLKEILKEMKNSLPKKKNNEPNHILTEVPTLRIGSTIQEAYKNDTSQPSSSSGIVHNKNRMLSVSSLLSENQKNSDQKITSPQDDAISSGVKNINQCKVTSVFENKSNVRNSSERMSLSPQKSPEKIPESSAKDVQKHKIKYVTNSPTLLTNKLTDNNCREIVMSKVTQDNKLKNTLLKESVNTKITNHTRSHMPLPATKTNDSKEVDKSNMQEAHEVPDNRQYFSKGPINVNKISNVQNKFVSTSAMTSVTSESDNINHEPTINQSSPESTKLEFLNFSNSRALAVNSVTVVTTHHNSGTTKNIDKHSLQTSASQIQNVNTVVTDVPLKSRYQNDSPNKNIKITKNLTYLENKADLVKPNDNTPTDNVKADNLHTPLNISSLLNPPNSSNNSVVKQNISSGTNYNKNIDKDKSGNFERINTNKDDPNLNKELLSEKVTAKLDVTKSDFKTTYPLKDFQEPQIRETVKINPVGKNMTIKDFLSEQKELPSTSGCSSTVTNSNNNVDKFNHYHQRRHLINQLEQSIAKGDEVAAAEAAVKLAKLRLSCSVLSFSSQIVGENSSAKQNNTNKQYNDLNTNITSNVKPLEQSIAQVTTPETVELVDTEIKSIKPLSKVLGNKKVSDDTNGIGHKSNLKPQLLTGEPSSSTQVISEDIVPINVWIEDKQAARGPIRLNISRRATVADLRRQAEQSLGLASQLQRWIVGRTLCSDDASPIVTLAGPYLKAPFYLCIVQPDLKDKPVTNEVTNDIKNDIATNLNGEFYTELMKLEKQSLVPNIEPFECGVCMEECAAGAGVILRECIHTFCRECLSDVVQHSQEPAVACPAMGCSGFLQEREIRTIVSSEEYERWLARGLATAECGTRNAFHCRTRDCTGWAFCDPGVRRFPCPVCKNTNCVQCQAIHEGETCEQYQTKLRQAVTAAETNKDDEGTQAFLNSLMSRGEALECPECRAIITKKWGCDWVKCSACKTEICWVTKGRRWGSGGRGDTSGGCRCGVDGQRCHPSCAYCH